MPSNTIAGVDVGAELLSVFGGDADADIVYRHYTLGGDQADINAGPTRTPTDYSCLGYPEAMKLSAIPDALVRTNMMVFGIYRDSLGIRPSAADGAQGEILHGPAGSQLVYQIYEVQTDSTQAVWVVYTQLKGAA